MSARRCLALGLIVVAAVAAAAGAAAWYGLTPAPPAAEPDWFSDVTAEVGIDFVHDAGTTGKYFLPQIFGAGAAVLDADGDGLPDLLFLQSGGPGGATNRLYRQRPGGRFEDVSAGSGLDFAGHNTGVAVGDIDNDGRPDVVITQLGGLKLLRNVGGGKFEDVTRQAGLDSPYWGTSAALMDLDGDGRLDLVVANYVDLDPTIACRGAGGGPDFCHPDSYRGTPAQLFRNVTEPGGPPAFRDDTARSGLGRLRGRGLGVVCHDFDGDGRPDIFVANDLQPNHLWINRGDGTFVEEGALRGAAYNGLGQRQANMGIALADLDGDGLADLYVTHLTDETNTLWAQGPAGHFQDATARRGLAATRWRGTGFGVVAVDFDHDGRPDLAIANGRVSAPRPSPRFAWADYAERNQLLTQDGAGLFRDISPRAAALCGTPGVYRGLLWADLDGDGAPDLVVTQVAGPARILRNVAPERGHWLLIRAVDPAHHRDAYGAQVTVRAGGRRWLGLINPAHSFQCSNDARAHFGLGGADRVDAIEVRWPGGERETFSGGPADRALTLVRGQGRS